MGKKQFVQIYLTITVLSCLLLSSCAIQGQLELISVVDTKVPEASGLAIKNDTLYIVSDKNGDIYRLDTLGVILDRLKTKTEDVEGITWCNGKILLANESNQKVYTYDAAGNRLDDHKLDYPKIYNPQNGLEGITYDKYSDNVLVIVEKESGQLLRLDTSFVLIKQNFLGSFSDYSGVATTKDHIWIISDEAQGVVQYDRSMNLIKIYSLGFDSPEGIAIDEKKKKMYVVSDSTSELFTFKLPEGE